MIGPRRAIALAIRIAIAVAWPLATAGCRRAGLRNRTHRALARPFAIVSGGETYALSRGFATREGNVLRVVLTGSTRARCGALDREARLSFRLPGGPRGDFFGGETIGVRVEAEGIGARGGFGLDAEEVALRVEPFALETARVLRGALQVGERYHRIAGRRARGAGRFVVEVCPAEPTPAATISRALSTRPATAHVATLPDGRRAITKLRFEGAQIEHPAFAAEGRVRLGVAGPARVRVRDGTLGWDAWVRFDALDLAPNGRARGHVEARAGGIELRGDFDAKVEP